MKYVGSDGSMMRRGEVLGVVVRDIYVAGCLKDKEVSLFDSVANPVETHVHGATATLFDGVIGNAGGAGVIRL